MIGNNKATATEGSQVVQVHSGAAAPRVFQLELLVCTSSMY